MVRIWKPLGGRLTSIAFAGSRVLRIRRFGDGPTIPSNREIGVKVTTFVNPAYSGANPPFCVVTRTASGVAIERLCSPEKTTIVAEKGWDRSPVCHTKYCARGNLYYVWAKINCEKTCELGGKAEKRY